MYCEKESTQVEPCPNQQIETMKIKDVCVDYKLFSPLKILKDIYRS